MIKKINAILCISIAFLCIDVYTVPIVIVKNYTAIGIERRERDVYKNEYSEFERTSFSDIK